MKRASLPERRKSARRGVAVRVVLRDHRPPIHAMTRNVSLGGMSLMTATRKVSAGSETTAEVEVDERRERWSSPLPVKLVWRDHTSAGVMFGELPDQARKLLSKLLEDAVPRSAGRRYQRKHA